MAPPLSSDLISSRPRTTRPMNRGTPRSEVKRAPSTPPDGLPRETQGTVAIRAACVPRRCASSRVRPSAAPIIQRAHKQPWAAPGGASSPQPLRELTTSSLIRTTPVPKPPPTPRPMRPTTSCRPCASAARELWRRRRRASRRRPCPTTATPSMNIVGLASSPTRGGAPTATSPNCRRRIDCR